MRHITFGGNGSIRLEVLLWDSVEHLSLLLVFLHSTRENQLETIEKGQLVHISKLFLKKVTRLL